MNRVEREAAIAQLEELARTGGGDTREAIKTMAGILVDALGPSGHERAVEQVRKHGSKAPEQAEVPADNSVAGQAARGRDVSQADLEAEQQEKADARAARREEEGRLPGGDVVTIPAREDEGKQAEPAKTE